jgi:hypothetical protein
MKVNISNFPNLAGANIIRCKYLKWRFNKYLWDINNDEFTWYDRLVVDGCDAITTVCNKTVNRLLPDSRRISVDISDDDTWSLDTTLAYIIAPALTKFKNTMHSGTPDLDKSDYPTDMTPSDGWKYILDEMIFAFESTNDDGENEFNSGNIDFVTKEIEVNGEKMFELVEGPDHTFAVDQAGLDIYNARRLNGRRLFAVYFENLWS